jgi:hypothetical protein
MKRWLIPIIYFALCESLALLYELFLARQIDGIIGTISVFILLLLAFPGVPLGRIVEQHTAAWLDLPFGAHSFWPRMAGTQTMILTCTVALIFFVWLTTLRSKSEYQSPNP